MSFIWSCRLLKGVGVGWGCAKAVACSLTRASEPCGSYILLVEKPVVSEPPPTPETDRDFLGDGELALEEQPPP